METTLRLSSIIFLFLILIYANSCKVENYGTCNLIKDSNTFSSIQVCNQIWIAKNLDIDHYRNGDPIPQVSDPIQWQSLTTGAWCYWNNDPSTENIYGKLYNWYAVHDSRILAPFGWHVPSDSEFTELSICFGGDSIAGGKLKESGYLHWLIPNTGATNTSNFTALPNGWRVGSGDFSTISTNCLLWSSTESQSDSTKASYRYMSYLEMFFLKYDFSKNDGLSVRCIKD